MAMYERTVLMAYNGQQYETCDKYTEQLIRVINNLNFLGMANYKQGGYEKKYIISKANGNPTDPNADYFVLRLVKDPHAQKALISYMKSVRVDNEQLANNLEQKLINEYGWEKN